ncbi:MFS transporter [Sulfuricystis thermophila]|uniref:MFS transporter n=1 Tax=Sulfuricystis thermophila TaxID=2496847 RepID=UPI0010369932|nr:MFS transporter [Sulfuricystis thermophila]
MTLDSDNGHARRRLIALAVIVAAYVLSFFQRFAPAGIAPDLAAAFETSAASLGVLAATYFYVYTVMQVPTGILVDTLGPRRILLIGGCVAGLGSLLFGMAQGLNAALVGRTLVGLGVSVVFIAMLKFIAVWFEEHRFASVVGASMLIGNFGSVLAGSPLSWMAQNVGWRGVFVGVGIVSLALGLLAWLFVRDRPWAAGGAVPPAPTSGVVPPEHSVGVVPPEHPGFDRTVILTGLLRVVKNRATWPAVFVNTGLSGSFFAFGGLWAMPFLTQGMGLSRDIASAHLSLYFAGFAVGCLAIGALSDRMRRRKPVVIVSSVILALIWPVWLSGLVLPLAATYLLFGLMGLMTASFTLSWACAKEVNPPALSGMSTSVANMGGFLMGALLQPAVGKIMDLRWSGLIENGVRIYAPEDYRWGLLLIAGAAWLGAAAAWFVRETHCRNVWKEIAKETT